MTATERGEMMEVMRAAVAEGLKAGSRSEPAAAAAAPLAGQPSMSVVLLVRNRQTGMLQPMEWDNEAQGLPIGGTTHTLLSTTHGDTTSATPVRGGIITAQGATPLWTQLALGSAGKILRSDGTDLAYSTATYPNTTTVSQLLYSSATNVIGGLATANSSVLVTGATGIPAWSGAMTNGQLIVGSTGAAPAAAALTGTVNQVAVTNGAASITLSTPQDIHTAATPTFASMTLPATGSLTLGTASSATGQILLKNSTNAFILTLVPAAVTASFTVTLPDASGARTVPYLERANTWTVSQCLTGTSGESLAQGANPAQANIIIGYDAAATAIGSGFISAVHWGTAWKNLRLASFQTHFYGSGTLMSLFDENRNLVLSNGAGAIAVGTGGVGNIGVYSGTAPATSPADYAAAYVADWNGAATAAWHFRNEETHIIRLFKGAALTASDGTLANAVIRIGELEARLQASGQIT